MPLSAPLMPALRRWKAPMEQGEGSEQGPWEVHLLLRGAARGGHRLPLRRRCAVASYCC